MYRQVAVYIYLLLSFFDSTTSLTRSICATVPDGNYVRSSQSCNSYEQCIKGQPIHGVCPRGYSFNTLNQMCDYNINVICQSCSPFGIQNIPHPDSCYMYYRCVNGVRTTMVCTNGLAFDRIFGDCNVAERVICEQKNRICEPFSGMATVTIGNPLDCTSYYVCINGNAFEMICPSGLFYNPHTASCEALGNFCQGSGTLITSPRPVITTREALTTQSTTRTTVRVIYVTSTTAPRI